QFRARERAAAVISSCDEHLAVGQQRRRVSIACGAEASGGGPGPRGRIVQFRARENAAGVISSRDDHLGGGQRRRRVSISWGGEAAGDIKSKRGIGGREAQGRHWSYNHQVLIA